MAGCGFGVGPTLLPGEGTSREYVVSNIDGPPIDVVVNDVEIAHLTCGATGVDLLAERGVPPLPWRIELRRDNGSALYSGTITEILESRKLVVRGETATELPWYASAGPQPRSPCPP